MNVAELTYIERLILADVGPRSEFGDAPTDKRWAEYDALTRRADASVWRDIATAPRDGRVILGWWSSEYCETIAFRGGEWVWSNDHDSWCAGSGPTHWIPLPPAPGADSAAPESDHQTGFMPADERQPASAEPEPVAYLSRRGNEIRVVLAKFVSEAEKLRPTSNGWTHEPLYAYPTPMTAQAAAQVRKNTVEEVVERLRMEEGATISKRVISAIEALATEAEQ